MIEPLSKRDTHAVIAVFSFKMAKSHCFKSQKHLFKILIRQYWQACLTAPHPPQAGLAVARSRLGS